MVVSPDGSCRLDGVPAKAVEIKCPVPGQKYTTDVQYDIPNYYITQLLSEMAAMSCDELFYGCWSPKSTTVFRVIFDEILWKQIQKELSRIYGMTNSGRPTRKSTMVEELKSSINTFKQEQVTFLCEFPSSLSHPCVHLHMAQNQKSVQVHHQLQNDGDMNRPHRRDQMRAQKVQATSLSSTQQSIVSVETCLKHMYNIMQIPAKEIVVALISDMDRIKQSEQVHAMPIAYGLSGYSLTVESVRSMLTELLAVCNNKGLKVCALSTDGQFYKMCVRDANNQLLTVLQLAKDTWDQTKRICKADQIRNLMSMNYVGNSNSGHIWDNLDITDIQTHKSGQVIYVQGWKDKVYQHLYTPPSLGAMLMPSVRNKRDVESSVDCTEHNNLVDLMPPEAVRTIDDECHAVTECLAPVDAIQTCQTMANHFDGEPYHPNMRSDDANDDSQHGLAEASVENPNAHAQTHVEGHHGVPFEQQDVYNTILTALKSYDRTRTKPKWTTHDASSLKLLLTSSASKLKAKLSKNELYECCTIFKIPCLKALQDMTKNDLVDILARYHGNEPLVKHEKSPKKLRMILKDLLSRTYTKEAINSITATHEFLSHKLPNWQARGPFQSPITIGEERHYVWYSLPEYHDANAMHVPFLLDCHHLFVNARCFVCQNGIPGLGVSKEAWLEVAKSNKEIQVGLNIAMVTDMIDRQSNSIAQIVFGTKVEAEMRRRGYNNEAQFCATIRQWYNAEDTPGLPATGRHRARMDMRNMLLDSVNLATFPPPGSHIGGMPIIMFEGILTNIDRRIQLHALVPNHAYNVRAPNTLDAENLFSEFQELDPKSSGALIADDIPIAMETASFILQMRLDPNR